jgi:hypothetical protein
VTIWSEKCPFLPLPNLVLCYLALTALKPAAFRIARPYCRDNFGSCNRKDAYCCWYDHRDAGREHFWAASGNTKIFDGNAQIVVNQMEEKGELPKKGGAELIRTHSAGPLYEKIRGNEIERDF